MARLPQPGSDSGTWGDILNEYLSQTLKTDGTLKNDVVTTAAIAPNAITSTEIASDTITATQIADGSITETQLDSGVQTKLNAVAGTPDWNTITNKPAVIAEGANQAAARTAIGAGTSNLAIGTTSTTAKAGDYAPTKSDVGLGNVDNTSDANKPISSATQSALDAKADTSALTSGLAGKANTSHTHTASQISDSTTTGRSVLTAADAVAARTAIGAGTGSSNLVIGTTGTTAKAGDYAPTWTEVTSKPSTFTPATHSHAIADITATGTASASTYLRGDGSWATPSTSGPTVMMPAPSGDTSGTTDAANLATAKATLASGPGTIVFGNGLYWLPGNTVGPSTFQTWRGGGSGATKLRMTEGQNGNFIISPGFDTYNNQLNATLSDVITSTKTVSMTWGSTTLTVADSTGVNVGDVVAGSYVPVGSWVVSVTSTTIVISKEVTSTQASTTVNFSSIPMGWGIHGMSLDGNGYYTTSNTASRISRPSGLAVTPTGTTGSTTYSYRVTALNALGESAGCTSVTTSTGNATLTGSNYNALSWTAVTGATSYRIYRSSTTHHEQLLGTSATNSYNDNGTDSVTSGKFAPLQNTTAGSVLATYGHGFTMHDVLIECGAGLGWNLQGRTTTNFMFATTFNALITDVRIQANYGGGVRISGLTDGLWVGIDLNANGESSSTNGKAAFDVMTSGWVFDKFHAYGGGVQYGVRIAGTVNTVGMGTLEDGTHYLVMLIGNNNIINGTILYTALASPTNLKAIYLGGQGNSIRANAKDTPAGIIEISSGSKFNKGDINAHYYSYTPPSNVVVGSIEANSEINILAFNINTGLQLNGSNARRGVLPTSVKTGAYTAGLFGEMIPVDCTSGGVTITLPTTPNDRTQVTVKKIDSSGNAVTINRGGSDVFELAGGPTSWSLTTQYQTIRLQYYATGAIWYII